MVKFKYENTSGKGSSFVMFIWIFAGGNVFNNKSLGFCH